MGPGRRRKRGGKDGKPRCDEHVRAYRKGRRKENVRKCRDYGGYKRKRKEEGWVKGARIKRLRQLIRDALHDASGEVAGIVRLEGMAFRNRPYGVHAAYVNEHAGPVNAYGLKKVPSKSGLRGRARELAGSIDFAVGLPGDPSGFPVVGHGGRGTSRKGSYPGASSASRAYRWRRARRWPRARGDRRPRARLARIRGDVRVGARGGGHAILGAAYPAGQTAMQSRAAAARP